MATARIDDQYRDFATVERSRLGRRSNRQPHGCLQQVVGRRERPGVAWDGSCWELHARPCDVAVLDVRHCCRSGIGPLTAVGVPVAQRTAQLLGRNGRRRRGSPLQVAWTTARTAPARNRREIGRGVRM